MVTSTRPLIFLSLLVVFAAAATTAQEPDLDNDVIPQDKQPALPNRPQQSLPYSTTTEKPVTEPTETTKAPSSIKPTMDFFSRIIDDFIQIPIAALRAVNQLLNNISQRNRHAAALNATASTPVAAQTTTASR